MNSALLQRLQFQQDTPFARAIGLELLGWSHGTARTRLPLSRQTCTSDSDAQTHPWALIGLADHALSYAYPTLIPPDSGLSTLDLRIDFGPAAIGAVTATTTVHHHTPHHGMATLTATDEAQQATLAASALFNFRTFPGGGELGSHCRQIFENDHPGPFAAFLGLHQSDSETWLEGAGRRVIGFEGLPALHGGVVGALLAAACDRIAPAGMRLTTLHIRFLRPAGTTRLNASAAAVRAGRSAAFISATCWHEKQAPVADAQATYTPVEIG